MAEITLAELVARVEELERRLAALDHEELVQKKDWRSVVGICEDNEFTRQMEAEIAANSEAELRAAQQDSEAG